MSTTTQVQKVKINKMTKARYGQTTPVATEFYMLTDVLDPQYDVLPTADAKYADQITQYTGATGGGLTNGYFYKCAAQGTSPETYAWEQTDVQPSSGGSAKNVITLTGESGVLTDAQIAQVLDDTAVLEIVCDGVVFRLSNRESTLVFRTFISTDCAMTENVAFKVIYVNTNSSGANYKHWNLEDVSTGGGGSDPTAIKQVEELPDLTTYSGASLVQYVGESDSEQGLFNGAFYKKVERVTDFEYTTEGIGTVTLVKPSLLGFALDSSGIDIDSSVVKLMPLSSDRWFMTVFVDGEDFGTIPSDAFGLEFSDYEEGFAVTLTGKIISTVWEPTEPGKNDIRVPSSGGDEDALLQPNVTNPLGVTYGYGNAILEDFSVTFGFANSCAYGNFSTTFGMGNMMQMSYSCVSFGQGNIISGCSECCALGVGVELYNCEHVIGLGTYYTLSDEANSLWVGLYNDGGEPVPYKLLDGNGYIPTARLADTTSATAGQVLTLDSNLNAVWASGGSSGVSDVTVNGTSVVSGGVAAVVCPEIDDTSTTSTSNTWSASKLNTMIGNVEALLANI